VWVVSLKKRTRKAPGALDPAVVLPLLWVQFVFQSLKTQALSCVAEDMMSICLGEQKAGVWAK